MSNSNIGLGSQEINRQWEIDKKDKDIEVQKRAVEFKDGISKSVKQESTPQANYIQDVRYPKIAEPNLQQNSDIKQPENLIKKSNLTPEEQGKLLDGPISVFLTDKSLPLGKSRVPLEFMKGGQVPLNNQDVQQFSQKNGVDPGTAQLSYFFAKANPQLSMSSPFTNIKQEIQQQSLTDQEQKQLEEAAVKSLLNEPENSGNIEELSLKLGVPPEEVKELVHEAYLSGGYGASKDIAKFAESLGQQASAKASEQRQSEAYNRVVYASDEQVNELAKKLGVSPEEVRSMLLRENENPDPNAPAEIKELAEEMKAASQAMMEEPQIDEEAAYNALVDGGEGITDEKIQKLALQLGLTPEEVREMLKEAFNNPGANLPLPIIRLSESLADKAGDMAREGALGDLTGQIFDAKLAGNDERILALAKLLNIPVAQAKVLVQKALANPESADPSALMVANALKKESGLEAHLRLSHTPSSKDANATMAEQYDIFFDVEIVEHNIKSPLLEKILFAKNNPQLLSSLNPRVVAIYKKLESSAKEAMESSYGVPRSFNTRPIPNAPSEIGTETYDKLFEEELSRLRSNGEINTQEVALLRELHYHPDSNFPTPQAIKERFEQIQSLIIPQVIATVGAPNGWKPRSGIDRASANINGEVFFEIDEQLDAMEEAGSINAAQKAAIKAKLTKSGTPTPEELAAVIEAVMKNSIAAVASRSGLDASSVDGVEPMGKSLPSNLADLMKNGIRLSEESINIKQNLVDQMAPGSPTRAIYLDYLFITRTAMQSMKEYLYFEAAGDAQRCKKLAVAELEMQIAKLEQMKRAMEAMRAAMEKAEEMETLMIVMAVLTIIFLAVVAIVLAPMLVWVSVILVVCIVLEIVALCESLDHSDDAEGVGWASFALQMFLEILLAIVLFIVTLGTATPLIVAWFAMRGLVLAAQIGVKALLAALKALLIAIIDAVIEIVMEAVNAILASLAEMVSEAIEQLSHGLVETVIRVVKEIVNQIIRFCKYLYEVAKAPVDKLISGGRALYNGAKGFKEAADAGRGTKYLTDALSNAAKDAYKSYRSMDMAEKAQAANRINDLGQAFTGTTQAIESIASAEKDQVLAEAAAIKAMMEAALAKVDETIASIRKWINKILENLQVPMEWIALLSNDQNAFWKQMSDITTGIARSSA